MVTLYVITMTLCLHSHYVWPSQWLCALYNEGKPSQWLCMASQWLVCLHDDLVPSNNDSVCLSQGICVPFTMTSVCHNDSECPSQWLWTLTVSLWTLTVTMDPHNDYVPSQWLWVGSTVALCNNLCALIVNLCLLTKPQCSFHNDFARPSKDSIWPSHCMPSQCLCTFTMTWVPWQWLHVTFAITLCDLQKE